MDLLFGVHLGVPRDGEGKDWQPRADRGASLLALANVRPNVAKAADVVIKNADGGFFKGFQRVQACRRAPYKGAFRHQLKQKS